jgi:hypothetical protein
MNEANTVPNVPNNGGSSKQHYEASRLLTSSRALLVASKGGRSGRHSSLSPSSGYSLVVPSFATTQGSRPAQPKVILRHLACIGIVNKMPSHGSGILV